MPTVLLHIVIYIELIFIITRINSETMLLIFSKVVNAALIKLVAINLKYIYVYIYI